MEPGNFNLALFPTLDTSCTRYYKKLIDFKPKTKLNRRTEGPCRHIYKI